MASSPSTTALRLVSFAALLVCIVLGDRTQDHGNGTNIQGTQPTADRAAAAAAALTRVPANQAPEHANVAESTKLGAETNGNRAANAAGSVGRDRIASKHLRKHEATEVFDGGATGDASSPRVRVPFNETPERATVAESTKLDAETDASHTTDSADSIGRDHGPGEHTHVNESQRMSNRNYYVLAL